MSKTQIAAIEFGTSKIVTMIAEASGIDRLEFIGAGTVPYDGYMNGDWNTPKQMIKRVHDSIAAAELEAKKKIREIYVGVPGEYIHVLSTESDLQLNGAEVTENEMNAVQDVAAEKLRVAERGGMVLHRSPAWFQIDNGKRSFQPNGHGEILHANTSFVIADLPFIEDVKEIMARLDITIMGFLAPSLGEAILLVPNEERDHKAILIDCGYLNSEISVIDGDAIVYHAILPMGGGHITADLSRGLNIPMRAAEQIKRNYVFNPDEFDRDALSEVTDGRGRKLSFPRETVSRIVERTVGELAEMIEKTISTDCFDFMEARTQIYMTGGGLSLMRGAREYLSSKIGRPVKQATSATARFNSPVYGGILGLLDLTFNSIELRERNSKTVGKKLSGLLKKR